MCESIIIIIHQLQAVQCSIFIDELLPSAIQPSGYRSIWQSFLLRARPYSLFTLWKKKRKEKNPSYHRTLLKKHSNDGQSHCSDSWHPDPKIAHRQTDRVQKKDFLISMTSDQFVLHCRMVEWYECNVLMRAIIHICCICAHHSQNNRTERPTMWMYHIALSLWWPTHKWLWLIIGLFTVVWSTFCVMTVFLFYDLCVFVIYEAIGGDTRQCDSLYLLMLKSIYFFQWTIFMPMRLENNIMYKLTAYDEPSPLCCMNLFVHFSGHCWQCRHWLRLPNPMLFAGHMSTEMHCILRRWTNEV